MWEAGDAERAACIDGKYSNSIIVQKPDRIGGVSCMLLSLLCHSNANADVPSTSSFVPSVHK